MLDLAERLGSDLIVSLGAYLAPVSHTGPTVLTGRGTRPELRRALTALGLRDGKYEGPAGFLHRPARGHRPARPRLGVGVGRQPDLPARSGEPEAVGGPALDRRAGAAGRPRPDRA